MVSSAASVLADQAAALVTATRQWQIDSPIDAFKADLEDSLEAIEEQIERISDMAKPPSSDRSRLDSMGTELWNACRIQVMEASLSNRDSMAINIRVLAIAVALLDLASPFNHLGHIRILELGIEAARVCIDTTYLDSALKIIKVAAKRLDPLETYVPEIEQVHLSALSAEYYMLRVHLACQQGRLDIADHLFSKVPLKSALKNRSTVIERCLCIGRGALEAGQNEAAIKWLDIALDELQENLDNQGLNSGNFELQTRHTLACAYMKIDTPKAAKKLEEQTAVLLTKYGDNPAVHFLELEIIRREENPSSDDFFRVLRAIIEKLDHTEEYLNVSPLLSTFQSPWLYQIFDALESLPCDKRGWIEECFLRLAWMVNSAPDELEVPEETCMTAMNDALAFLKYWGIEIMSQEATHVFITILLSMLENPEASSRRQIAEKWCLLTLNTKVFNDCFTSAKFNLQKRLATVFFGNNNLLLARQTLDRILTEKETKSDLQIQCLLFKLGLHDEKDVYLKDYALELSLPDQLEFFRGCAVEADRLNKSNVVIDCILEFMNLTTLREISQEGGPVDEARSDLVKSLATANSISFPLSMLSSVMEKEQAVCSENVLDLTYSGKTQVLRLALGYRLIFEVLRWAKQGLRRIDLSFSVRELESICLDSYNLTLHIFNRFPLERSEKTMEITKEVLDLSRQRYESIQTETPQSLPLNSREENTEKQMSFQLGYITYQFLFLEVSIHALCVRSQIDSTSKFEHYTKTSKAINSIREQSSEYSESHPLDIDTLRNLSANEFEATIALERWSAIVTIIQDSQSFFDAALFDHFMSCILTFEMADPYRAVSINTMVEIIRRAGPGIPIPFDNLPFYYHQLFTFALTAAKSDYSARLHDLSLQWPDAYYGMAESVIDEVLTKAAERSSPSGSAQYSYPVEELGYLATCSFNQALDFYSAENDQACLRWAQKAILLAEAIGTPESEDLVCLFQKRLKGLF
ncbi:hypothetical protein PEBR_13978 [Penicillium brasilianum]|uniref:Protein ZIP4 homolog n=1 Tax=Penicillium brasilianum TaxID=104259 RepID=A0A1S9RS17_PENBI|nr:hypothetical protein PEBR_13978 [Penicillium brasilianum]